MVTHLEAGCRSESSFVLVRGHGGFSAISVQGGAEEKLRWGRSRHGVRALRLLRDEE